MKKQYDNKKQPSQNRNCRFGLRIASKKTYIIKARNNNIIRTRLGKNQTDQQKRQKQAHISKSRQLSWQSNGLKIHRSPVQSWFLTIWVDSSGVEQLAFNQLAEGSNPSPPSFLLLENPVCNETCATIRVLDQF